MILFHFHYPHLVALWENFHPVNPYQRGVHFHGLYNHELVAMRWHQITIDNVVWSLKNVKCRLSLPIRGPRKVENISIDCVEQTNQSKISLHSTTTNEIFWEFFSQLSSLFTLEAVYFALVHSWKNKNELSIVDSVPRVSLLALKPICKDYKHIRSVV